MTQSERKPGPRERVARRELPPSEVADDLRAVAIRALVDVASNGDAPAAARAAAARTLMESIGAIGRLQDLDRVNERRNSAEMTPREIADEIARLSTKVPTVKLKRIG